MALPDGDIIPLEVIADRWTKLFGELVTVERLWSWCNAGMLTIDSQSDFRWRNRRNREDMLKVFPKGFIMHEYWITREERDRFEREHVSEAPKPKEWELNYLIERYLDKEPDGGFPGLKRFLKNEGAEFVTQDRVRWFDPAGKKHIKKVHSIENQLSVLKGKRRKKS